jgi:hypothetical protein
MLVFMFYVWHYYTSQQIMRLINRNGGDKNVHNQIYKIPKTKMGHPRKR